MISCDVVADAKEKELPDVAATPQSTSSHAASSAMVLTSAVGSGVGGGGVNARSDVHQDREWNSSGPRAALAAALFFLLPMASGLGCIVLMGQQVHSISAA